MQCFLPSPTLQFYSFITCHKVWNIPLPCLGWLSWCCPLGILCHPYWQDSMRSTEMETPLALCSTAQQQLKHQCIINTVVLPKPNYSIISDNIKKIISVSAETRTEGDSWGHIIINHMWFCDSVIFTGDDHTTWNITGTDTFSSLRKKAPVF